MYLNLIFIFNLVEYYSNRVKEYYYQETKDIFYKSKFKQPYIKIDKTALCKQNLFLSIITHSNYLLLSLIIKSYSSSHLLLVASFTYTKSILLLISVMFLPYKINASSYTYTLLNSIAQSYQSILTHTIQRSHRLKLFSINFTLDFPPLLFILILINSKRI